jgi:hypothetical protein
MTKLTTANGHSAKDLHSSPVEYLIHGDEPPDNYEAYLATFTKSAKRNYNPHNLFDDANHSDRAFLRAVRKFIKEKTLS